MADEFYEDEEEYEGPPVPKFWKILGKCIKYSAIGLIVFVNALVLWRVFFSTNEPAAIKTVAGNAALREAYTAYLNDPDVNKMKFALYQAGQDNIATDEDWHDQFELAEDEVKENEFAQFFFTDVVFFPYAGQTQVVLRYNRSVLPHLAKDFGLESTPKKGEDLFDVTLVVTYKSKEDDAEKSMRLKATLTAKDTTSLYVFNQLSFEGMPEFESITEIKAEIYYKEAVDYNARPYATIDVYDKKLGTRTYDLDKKDIAAIKGAE